MAKIVTHIEGKAEPESKSSSIKLELTRRSGRQVQFCSRFPKIIFDALSKYAAEIMETRSNLVRDAVYDYLHSRGKI